MLLALCVILAFLAIPFFFRGNGPAAIVERALSQFDRMSELDFAPLEREMQKRFPQAPERDLLYALRISKTVPRVTKLKTLASRWNTANYGAAASGLSLGKSSAAHPKVFRFLCAFYLQRLDALLSVELQTHLERISARKTALARANAIEKAEAAMEELRYEFLHDLPGAVESIERTRLQLQSRIQAQ